MTFCLVLGKGWPRDGSSVMFTKGAYSNTSRSQANTERRNIRPQGCVEEWKGRRVSGLYIGGRVGCNQGKGEISKVYTSVKYFSRR